VIKNKKGVSCGIEHPTNTFLAIRLNLPDQDA